MRKSCVALGVYGRIHQGDDQSLHSQHILGGSQQKRRQKSPNLRWSRHSQKLSKICLVSRSGNQRQVFSAGSLRLDHEMNRETTVTGKGFSTYVECGIRPSAAPHSTLYNALQQIVYRILDPSRSANRSVSSASNGLANLGKSTASATDSLKRSPSR